MILHLNLMPRNKDMSNNVEKEERTKEVNSLKILKGVLFYAI